MGAASGFVFFPAIAVADIGRCALGIFLKPGDYIGKTVGAASAISTKAAPSTHHCRLSNNGWPTTLIGFHWTGDSAKPDSESRFRRQVGLERRARFRDSGEPHHANFQRLVASYQVW